MLPSHSEDPLTYLPRKPLVEYAKGREIYNSRRKNTYLFVVIKGRVKVSAASDEGCQTIGRIVTAEGLFGESCLVEQAAAHDELALALDPVALMAWSAGEVLQQIEREPWLGVALAQYLARQCQEMQDRIESMAVHKTPERVMLALLQLAGGLGAATGDTGIARLASLTHQTIAEFVGTSREIVTFQMNRLRRAGFIHYSRQYLDIGTEAIENHLREKGVRVPARQSAPARRAAG
jgi:CRP-like cAMP-binding protein